MLIPFTGVLVLADSHHLPWLKWGTLAAVAAAAGSLFTFLTGLYKNRHTVREIKHNIEDRRVLGQTQKNISIVPSGSQRLRKVVISREPLLKRLTILAESVWRANAKAAFISGETGLGKSWLVEEFLDKALMKGEGTFVLKVSCSLNINEVAAPYESLLDALGELVKQEQLHREVVALFRTEAPSWYDNSVKPERTTDLQSSSPHTKLIELTSFFDAIAARGLMVLLIDDVQWLDRATLSLLPLLMDKLNSSRLLLLLTYRKTPTEPVPSLKEFCTQAHRKGYMEDIEVPPFTRDELELYLKRRQPELLDLSPEISDSYTRMIEEVSGCNPLFADNLLDTEQNALVLKNLSSSSMQANKEVLKANLPDSMRAVIQSRFQSLTRPQMVILEQATYQGILFDSRLLSTALGLPMGEIEEELKELEKTFLIEWRQKQPLDDRSPSDRYEFRHQEDIDYLRSRIRSGSEQKYAQGMATAQELHNGLSLKLSSLRLAKLFQLAGMPDKQASYLVLAAEACVERGAFSEGIRLVDEALELLGGLPQTERTMQLSVNGDLLAGLALAFLNTYSPDAVHRRYEAALRKAELLRDDHLRFPALAGVWLNHLVNARLLEAYELAKRMVRISLSTSTPAIDVTRSEASWAVGVTAYFRGSLLEAQDALTAGIATYHRANHQQYAVSYPLDPGVACRYLLGRCLWLLGFPDQGLEQTSDAIRLGRELNHRESLAFSWSSKAIVHHLRGEASQVLEVKKDMEYELGSGQPLRQFTAWPIILAGWAASMLGDIEGGLKEVERGLLIYRDQGSSLVLPSFNSIYGECLLRARLPLRAREVIDSALADSRAQDQRYAESQLLRLRGLTLLDASDSVESREEAMSCFVAAESIASSQGARGFQLRAATSILQFATGDQMISAYRNLVSLLATFQEGHDTHDYITASTLINVKSGCVQHAQL